MSTLPDCMKKLGLEPSGATSKDMAILANYCEDYISEHGIFVLEKEKRCNSVNDLVAIITEQNNKSKGAKRLELGACVVRVTLWEKDIGRKETLLEIRPQVYAHALITHTYKGYCDSSVKGLGSESTVIVDNFPVSTRLRLNKKLSKGLVKGDTTISVITDSDRKRTVIESNYDLNKDYLHIEESHD